MSEIEVKVMKNESSKKCLDEKFKREKKAFELLCEVLEEKDLIKKLGVEDYTKLKNYYSKKERGQVLRTDYSGMDIMEVFKQYGLGVKEVCKKGYEVVDNKYVRIEK